MVCSGYLLCPLHFHLQMAYKRGVKYIAEVLILSSHAMLWSLLPREKSQNLCHTYILYLGSLLFIDPLDF